MDVSGEIIEATYLMPVVFMSLLMAAISSYNAINLLEISRSAPAHRKKVWLSLSAISLGLGIWILHFMGMEALQLPISMGFTIEHLLFAAAVAVLLSFAVIWLISKERRGWPDILITALLMGCGISSLHYIGMAAMQMPAIMVFDITFVTVSVLAPCALSFIALKLAFILPTQRKSDAVKLRVQGAGLMGLAIASMHYLGMAAVDFVAGNGPDSFTMPDAVVGELGLSIAVTIVMLLMLLPLLLNSLDVKKHIFGVAQKITLLSSVITLFTILIIGYSAYKEVGYLLLDRAIERVHEEMTLNAMELNSNIASLRQDVRFLANTPPIQGIMRAHFGDGMDHRDHNSDRQWHQRLEIIFTEFLKSHPEYLSVRYIGVEANGRELIRVGREADQILVTGKDKLQQKSHRDYFQKTLQTNKGDIYLSEANYNRDHGTLVVPYMPVIRASMSVFDSAGNIFGMIVINKNMSILLEQLADAEDDGSPSFVVNDQGDYLVHPDSSKVFGFEFAKQHLIQDEFPEVERAFQSAENNYLFINAEEVRHVVQKIYFDPVNPERFIALVEQVSPSHLENEAAVILERITIYSQFIIAMAMLAAFLFSLIMMRPLRSITGATEAFADGVLVEGLPVQDKSEIGDLARTFVAMVGQIKERSAEVESAKEVLEKTFASLDSAVLIVEPEQRMVISCNDAACRMFGYEKHDLMGSNTEKLFVSSDAYDDMGGQLVSILDSGLSFHVESMMKRQDDSAFPSEHTVTEIKDISGKRAAFVHVINDITNRKDAEAKLLQNYKLSTATTRALSVFISQTDRESIFEQILEDLRLLSGSEFGVVASVKMHRKQAPDTKLLSITESAWTDKMRELFEDEYHKTGLELHHKGTLFGEVLQTLQPVISNDPRKGVLPEGHPRLDSFLGLPLMLGKELVGIVGLANREGGYDTEIADYLAPLLQTCANVLGADRNNQRRRKAEKHMKLSAKVFESALEGIIVTDVKGTIQSVNPSYCTITGYSENEIIGNNPRMMKSEHHEEKFYRNMWDTLLLTGKWQGEVWNRRKSGDAFPVWETISAIKDDDGEVTHYVAILFDISERKLAEEKLEYQAQHDILTGLPNRVLFDNLLKQILREVRRSHQHLALMFLDLDRFKEVNDTLGHPVGDKLLKEAAKRLETCIRDSDVLARMGGDEFTIVLRDIVSIEDACLVAEKIIKSLNEPFHIQEFECQVGVSIGISMFPDDSPDAETLIKFADTAMYRAKDNGRNGYEFFTPTMGDEIALRIEMKGLIDQAIINKEFEFFYQPKIDLATGHCIGAEALIRWILPNKEIVMPDVFLPLTEDTGQIIEIGAMMMEKACRQLKQWHEAGYHHSMAVNLSARQFESPDLISLLESAIDNSGLDPKYLELEVTETCAMREVKKSIDILNRIRSHGMKVSIDDFGTGYSSLSYLKKLPVSTLKVDRAFVMGIPDDSDDNAIATAIAQMASNLGLSVVAEGVETKEQADFLRQQGCQYGQGYFYSRPLPADQYMVWLEAYEKSIDL